MTGRRQNRQQCCTALNSYIEVCQVTLPVNSAMLNTEMETLALRGLTDITMIQLVCASSPQNEWPIIRQTNDFCLAFECYLFEYLFVPGYLLNASSRRVRKHDLSAYGTGGGALQSERKLITERE